MIKNIKSIAFDGQVIAGIIFVGIIMWLIIRR